MPCVRARPTARSFRLLLVGALMVGIPVAGLATEARPVAADCGMEGPSSRIADYRGFAVEGVVRSVEPLADDPDERRITIDVADTLAGPPVDTVAFVGGQGDCHELQGERFKVGDRLIVAAALPPIDDRVFDGWPLVWRYEWGDLWRLHGYQDGWIVPMLPREARRARTHADILGLVAADRLPYALTPWAFERTIAPVARNQGMRDVVAFGDGFVALGWSSPRWRKNAVTPTVHVSADGRAWTRVSDPFVGAVWPAVSVDRLVVFRDELWAFGRVERDLAAWRSTDGRTWTAVDGGAAFVVRPATRTGSPSVTGAFVQGDRLVVTASVSDGAPTGVLRTWSTTDGSTWAVVVSDGPLQQGWWSVTAGRDGLLSMGCCEPSDSRETVAITSPDGGTWSALGPLPRETQDLAWDPASASWLAASIVVEPGTASHATLARSVDGRSWSQVIDGPLEATQWLSLGLGDGALVMRSWSSETGSTSARPWARSWCSRGTPGPATTRSAADPRGASR